ncbi:MAG: hypothetical protein J7K23_08050 [Thermoproteales archaeon]|nr:hypothetical protein [Thermoproteales archaeon]
MARLFCPVCGKKVERLYNGMCEGCYKKTHPLINIPNKPIDIIVCPICGSYRIGKKWYNPKIQGDFSEIFTKNLSKKLEINGVLKNIKVLDDSIASILDQKKGSIIVSIEGRVTLELPYYEEKYAIPIKLIFKLCPKCIDIKSKKKMAKIQVRARNRNFTRQEISKVEKIINETLGELYRSDKSAVPVEVTVKENIIDYTFSSQKVARSVALRLKKFLGAELLETFKDAGISDRGRKLSKITYRILLPEFREGDIVGFKGKMYYIVDLSNKQMKLLSLTDYSIRNISLTKSLVNSINVIEKRESISYALVLSIVPPYVQVMCLDKGYLIKEVWLPKIPKWIEEGKKIGYITIDDSIFLIPIKDVP